MRHPGSSASPVSSPALKDCGSVSTSFGDPVFFAAKQPVRTPPWLTAHFSNLADLMEGGVPIRRSPRSASRIVLLSSNIRA
jgi:hypothetical protein